MITLAEKLMVFNIQCSVRTLSNDRAILEALKDVAKALQLTDTLARIDAELERNVEFTKEATDRLDQYIKEL